MISRSISLALLLLMAGGAQAQAPAKKAAGKAAAPAAQPSATQSPLQKSVEAYVRNLYAWGPDFQVKVGPPRPSMVPGFNTVIVEITLGQQSDSGEFYVSADGKYLLRGDLHDMAADPFAATRAQLRLNGSPSKGPANARVTVVEFSDFQCPACREMSKAIRAVLPQYPQVRFVFKHFPLPQIHPWAMNAALAAYCSYQQSPDFFWKFHDLVFDSQDTIKPDNAWERLLEIAGQAGGDTELLRVCMTSPEAKQAIEASITEGTRLKVQQTPTSFVNGRRMPGGDRNSLEQFIKFELAAQVQPAKAP